MFRPDDIGKIFGQDHLQEILLTWVEDSTKIPQQILFSGPYGTGKTTIARILANHLVTLKKDLHEINAADNRGIDDVRSWIESAKFSPLGSGGKVYIIDELHQMTTAAQSALLKIVEEPPPNIYFFLCTTEVNKLIAPIRSRCTKLELKLFNLQDTLNLISFVFNNRVNKQIAEAIHLKCNGHARDAVKMAELALISNITSVDELNKQVGLSYAETENLIYAILNGQATWQQAILLTSLQDAQVLDSFIDQAAINRCKPVLDHYSSLLTLRLARKEYKITVSEQILHFLSVCQSFIR